jgi:hypothetical protein
LLIQTADCQAVMLFDPDKRVAANIHCGWRGSVADIVGRTVAHGRRIRLRPGRMVAAIGPSLGPCCAEFVNYKQEIPRHSLWPFRVGWHHFDFWRISRHQLTTDRYRPEGNVHGCRHLHPVQSPPFFFIPGGKANRSFRRTIMIGWDGVFKGQARGS